MFYLAPGMCSFFRSHLLLLGLALVLVLSGCLTIEEHYTFKKNGSGTMEYVVDMSELGELISVFDAFDTTGESATQGQMSTLDMDEEVEALKAISGIKKVKLTREKEWVQRLQFGFKDIEALNAALNVLMPDSSGVPHEFFRWEGNTLVRTNNRHAYELGAGMSEMDAGEQEEGEELDPDPILETMKYRYSFKFANDIAEATTVEGVQRENVSGREAPTRTDCRATKIPAGTRCCT